MVQYTESDLNAMSIDELDAINQEYGVEIDYIRAERRKVNAARDAKIIAAQLRAQIDPNLSDEQVEAISAVISMPKVSLSGEVKNNG